MDSFCNVLGDGDQEFLVDLSYAELAGDHPENLEWIS
jgi:hypothetical protein